jgi:Tfp pilus assembly protein PilO
MTSLRQRVAIYASGVLSMLVLWYFIAYTPALENLTSVRSEVDTAVRQLADYSRTIQQLPEFLTANARLEAVRKELNSSLYAKSEIMDLFHQLTSDAQNHSLQLVQISPPVSELLELNRQASVDNVPLFLNLTLDFRGQYVDFGRFIGDLELKPYFRSVGTCVIRGAQTPEHTIDMSLSFKALIGTREAAS